jgi:hypothetical protein
VYVMVDQGLGQRGRYVVVDARKPFEESGAHPLNACRKAAATTSGSAPE